MSQLWHKKFIQHFISCFRLFKLPLSFSKAFFYLVEMGFHTYHIQYLILGKFLSTFFKGDIRCKILFYMVWTKMCVRSACTQPPYNDKNPPSAFFFKSPQITSTVSDQTIHRFLAEWRHTGRPHPRLLTNTAVLSDSPGVSCRQSAIVSTPEQG